jgi:histidinol-phosphate phosphatase family protein
LIEAVVVDRDGTIGGSDEVVYPGAFQLFTNVQESIDQLRKAGVKIFSFTNQPGISRGEATREEYDRELAGFRFDHVYLCPHGHEEGCDCRKPSPGMLLRAAKENQLNLQDCVVIGDRWTDMLAAEKAGCLKVLVKTGAGVEAFRQYQNNEYYGEWANVTLDFVADHFQQAVNWILSEYRQ